MSTSQLKRRIAIASSWWLANFCLSLQAGYSPPPISISAVNIGLLWTKKEYQEMHLQDMFLYSFAVILYPPDLNIGPQIYSKPSHLLTFEYLVHRSFLLLFHPQHVSLRTSTQTVRPRLAFSCNACKADSHQGCGPCKMISPVFEQLAQSEAKPGKLAFVKVNVDNHQDISGQYGVSA